MLKSLLFIYFLWPVSSFATEYSWRDIEAQVQGSSLEIQAQEGELRAAEKESKAASSPFLPNVSVNAGKGRDVRVSGEEQGTQVYVEGKWNLYRGGKDTAIKNKAVLFAEIKKTDLDITKRATLFKAKEMFTKLLAIKKLIEVIDRENELNQQQRSMAKKKVGAGLTSSVDEIEFDLRNDLILAERNKLLSEQEREIENLRSLLSLDEKPVTVSGDLVAPKNIDLKTVDLSLAPEGNNAQLSFKIAEADKKIVGSGFFPEINFIGAYGRLTLQENDPVKNNETSVLLSISLPLFSVFETYNLSKAESERVAAKEKILRQTQNNLNALEKNFRIRWKELWTLYELNLKMWERSKKYYDLTLGEYRRGIKNSPDLVSATEQLFDSEIKAIELTKDLIIIESDFEKTF